MKRMFLRLSALLILSLCSMAQALTLTCTEELSGISTTVSVPGARSLDEAKQTEIWGQCKNCPAAQAKQQ